MRISIPSVGTTIIGRVKQVNSSLQMISAVDPRVVSTSELVDSWRTWDETGLALASLPLCLQPHIHPFWRLHEGLFLLLRTSYLNLYYIQAYPSRCYDRDSLRASCLGYSSTKKRGQLFERKDFREDICADALARICSMSSCCLGLSIGTLE